MKKLLIISILFLGIHPIFGMQLIDKTPIKIIDNLIFIEVKINDNSQSWNFMFDSGAGVTAIDQSLEDKLDLTYSGETKIGTAGKSLVSKTSINNQLSIGEETELKDLTFYLMDLSHLSEYLKTNVDGILGLDLLNQLVVETNIDAMEMRFFSPAKYEYSGNSIPLQIISLESGHFGLPVSVTPKKSKESLSMILKIDTGAANHITLHNNAITEFDLLDPQKKYKSRKGFSIDSTITNNLRGKIRSAELATKEWRNLPVVFEIDPLNEISERQGDGLIGQALLLDFNMTYHLDQEVIYFEKRK